MKKDQVFLQAKGIKVLSRNELKLITGGPIEPGGECPGKCWGGDSSPWTAKCIYDSHNWCTCENPAPSGGTCGQ